MRTNRNEYEQENHHHHPARPRRNGRVGTTDGAARAEKVCFLCRVAKEENQGITNHYQTESI